MKMMKRNSDRGKYQLGIGERGKRYEMNDRSGKTARKNKGENAEGRECMMKKRGWKVFNGNQWGNEKEQYAYYREQKGARSCGGKCGSI